MREAGKRWRVQVVGSRAMGRRYTATHNTAEVTGETAGGALRVTDFRVPEAFFIRRT